MTAQEWMTCTDPTPMLVLVRGMASERKLRLFACACCRRVNHLIMHDVSRMAVEVGERFADGSVTDEERCRTWADAEEVWACLNDAYWSQPLDPTNEYDAAVLKANIHLSAITNAAGAATAAVGELEGEASVLSAWNYASEAVAWADLPKNSEYEDARVRTAERSHQALLLRHIIGNPFRPVSVDPSWRTNTVVALAQTIYEDRAFDRLPILADALEEAGCTNADILAHYRGPGPHVRGCWAVDLILGKS